jgi:hypothetical protein
MRYAATEIHCDRPPQSLTLYEVRDSWSSGPPLYSTLVEHKAIELAAVLNAVADTVVAYGMMFGGAGDLAEPPVEAEPPYMCPRCRRTRMTRSCRTCQAVPS